MEAGAMLTNVTSSTPRTTPSLPSEAAPADRIRDFQQIQFYESGENI